MQPPEIAEAVLPQPVGGFPRRFDWRPIADRDIARHNGRLIADLGYPRRLCKVVSADGKTVWTTSSWA
jgi:hypothetical protein